MIRRDPFEGMQGVDASGRRLPRIGLGMHMLRVTRCTMPTSGDVAFIAEFEVVESDNPSVAKGSKCSAYIASKFPDSLQRDVKRFLAAACGFDVTNEVGMRDFSPQSAAIARRAIGEENILEGRLVGVQGSPGKKTDPKTGQPYVDLVWLPVDEQWIPSEAATPPPPPAPAARATGCPADWKRSPDGVYALNPTTNKWHFAATGAPA